MEKIYKTKFNNQIGQLHKSLFIEDCTSFFENLKTKPYYKIYAVEQDDKLVAYCIITELGGECEVINIGVSPNARRCGVATRLLNFVLADCKGKKVFLEVCHKNLAAINLYKKCGFKQIYVRKNYYPQGDAIVMLHDN